MKITINAPDKLGKNYIGDIVKRFNAYDFKEKNSFTKHFKFSSGLELSAQFRKSLNGFIIDIKDGKN